MDIVADVLIRRCIGAAVVIAFISVPLLAATPLAWVLRGW